MLIQIDINSQYSMNRLTNIAHTRRETLRGVVVPEKWDDKYHVTQVHIACMGEREVRVENLANIPNLLTLSQTEGLFTGVVRRSGNAESIVVESYTALSGS